MKGRDIRSGTPREINLKEEDTAAALKPTLDVMMNGIKTALENTPPEFMLCRSLTGKGVPHGFLANPVNPGFFPGEVKSQREDHHHIEMIRLKSEQGVGIKNRIFCII